ncbi:hypothetical protein CEE44_04110 [Candidatus Woesearchaeota archaeon B3_Woes]|nr:MAG: hypothetical protein CEE44_04110 [Candidatus Woesearchaeota archaeon B3_Woes]
MNNVLKEIERIKSSEKILFKLDKNKKYKITLCYPDTYTTGMPNLGIQYFFKEINTRNDFFAGRCYLPNKKVWKKIVECNLPLYDWDSLEELKNSDILSFTVSFEDEFVNIVRMLKFAGINPIASERKEKGPLIIAGGPCSSYNPEPFSKFIDAFVIGEGETMIHKLLDIYKNSEDKKSFLRNIDVLESVYVPSFYDFEFEGKRIKKIIINGKENVYRNYVKNLDKSPICSTIINKKSQYKEEVFSIEVSRGCRMHCRFCYIGNHFRKQRVLSLNKIKELINEGKKYTKNIKLFYEVLPPKYYSDLFKVLLDFVKKDDIKLKLGSFRVEYLNSNIVNVVAMGNQDKIIIAPETSEGKLRNFINKGQMSDEKVKNAVKLCLEKSIKNFGLYLMVGIPTETKKDIDSLINLIIDVFNIIKDRNKKGILEVHINAYFPKPLTPLQLERNISQKEAIGKIEYIQSKIKIRLNSEDFKRVHFKTIVYDEISYSQPILTRGDRRLGNVLLDVCKLTYPYTNKTPTPEIWDYALRKNRLEAKYYYRERDSTEIMPWHIIKNNTSKTYFMRERERAYKGQLTDPCHHSSCDVCKSCLDVNQLMKIVIVCPPLKAPIKSWRYCPYHNWKFSFSTGDHGYSGVNMPICLIASFLRKKGINVDILDAFFEDISIEDTIEKISKYSIIGITVHSNVNLTDIKKIIKKLRSLRKNHKIVLGGHYPSYFPEKCINELDADFVIRGEGEESMFELIQCLQEGFDLTKVKGLTFKQKGRIFSNEPREKINNLDSLPFMARDYIQKELELKFVPAISSSRGCDYSGCSFCDIASFQKTSIGPVWRGRSAKNIVDEIEYITKKWKFNKFKFVDPNFVGGKNGRKRAYKIADEIIKRGLKVRYMFDTRVDEINKKLFKKLYKSGLRMVYLGVESCIQRQLDYFNKNTTLQSNKKAIKTLRETGIIPLFGIIVFEPTTTLEEIRKNFDYFISKGGFNIYRFVRGIIPRFGTPMMDMFEKQGILIKSYPDYKYKFENKEVRVLFNKSDIYAQNVFLIEKKYKEKILKKISKEINRPFFLHLERFLKQKTIEHFELLLKEFEINKDVSPQLIDKMIKNFSKEIETEFKTKLENAKI